MISALVITKSARQYNQWLIENGLCNADYKYAYLPEHLYGHRDIPIILIGEYQFNPLFPEKIADYLHMPSKEIT